MSATLDEVKSEERGWQNEVGGSLQDRAYERAGTRAALDRQHERIRAALALEPGMRALDLGCGSGHLLAWLAPRTGATLVGLDLALAPLSVGRANAPRCGFAAGDAERLPFRDASFDAVVCNGSAHHFLDLAASFSEIARVLKPTGVLLLHEPISSPVTEAVRRWLPGYNRYESPADLAQKSHFTAGTVASGLGAAGFGASSASYYDFLAFPLSGAYIRFPWSGWGWLIRLLIGIETRLERLTPLRGLYRAFAWRLLVLARRA